MHQDSPGLFAEEYLIRSTRLRGWDYAGSGWYFVTICTKPRRPWFGEIQHGNVRLSPIGQIVDQCWMEIPKHFPHVTLDDYVVMPDHFHGIIIIGERTKALSSVETCESHVSTDTTTQPDSTSMKHHRISRPKPGSLGSIINQFKSVCTKRIRAIEPDFSWQSRYYDHRLRHDGETARIRSYIEHNPTMEGLED